MAQEPVQHYVTPHCYDAETEHRSGTVEVTRFCERDNMASLTVDDGQGNRATVVVGWQQLSLVMASLGAVGVHM